MNQLYHYFSTFSVRANTIVSMVISSVVLRMVFGGLTLAVQLHMVMAWARTQHTFTLKITITVVTVLPSAV